MSGSQFVETLRALGLQGADKMDGQSLDWMFENEAILPFLEWFCDEVKPANLLQSKDLQEYRALEQSDCGVLEGEQLDTALQHLSLADKVQEDVGKLKEEIQQLEDELAFSQHRKDVLMQQRSQLSMHQNGLADRVAKMDKAEASAKTQYKACLQQSQADNTTMNNQLEGLLEGVSKLSALYQQSGAGTESQREHLGNDSEKPAVFLSQLSLHHYHRAEEKFTQELTAYTKKQFFEGISEMAGEDEGSRYEFLEISNPDSLLVRGEREEVNLDDCKELARLQATYPKSEAQRINAVVEEKSMKAACDFVDRKLQSLKKMPYPQDVEGISGKLSEAQSTLSLVRHDVASLAETEVPALVKESATLQVTKVLRGDYDLKIARQDYFTSNQDRVIEQLVVQRARYELLTMAYELEAKGHRDTHRLLLAVNTLIGRERQLLKDRMRLMEEPGLSSARFQRSTVDSRDNFALTLNNVLELAVPSDLDSSQKQMFVTYSQMEQAVDELSHLRDSLHTSVTSTNTNQDHRLTMLESSLRGCEALVYSGSSTVGGLPQLSPAALMDTHTQLDSVLGKLEKAVMDIIKDVDAKKKTLRSDPLVATERDLYVYFLTDPDHLRRALDDVSARLQAQMVT